jgi:hypothetical protein
MSRRYNGNMLISQLYHLIKKSLSIDQLKELHKLTKDIQKQEELGHRIMPEKEEELEELFKVELAINQIDLDKIIKCLSERQVLIIVDNLEDPLNSDAKNFTFILKQLLNKCENIKFLTTSRTPVGQFADIEESIYDLEELSQRYSVKLFFEKAKIQVDLNQIKDLLKIDGVDLIESQNDRYQLEKLLENHSLFKKLSGHPHAITLIA